jgi:ketosteroid isomerase-like protein
MVAEEPDPTYDVIDADDAFFAALLAADVTALTSLLTEDFVIVDVMSGGVSPRGLIVDAVGSGQLQFLEVLRDPSEASVRHRGGSAVVVGRTRMTMRFGEAETTVDSRYTHVFVAEPGGWRLMSAQGTPMPAA